MIQERREAITDQHSRFTDPPSFGDSTPAPIINGLKPGDDGYIQAWCELNGVTYTLDNSGAE